MTVGRCEDCGYGFYQDRSDQTYCLECPEGRTTFQTGSSEISDCFRKFNPIYLLQKTSEISLQ